MATQATALAPASQSALTKALSMKGEIVAYHQAATRAAEEAMENLFQCGRLLESVRDVLKAEKTTSFGKWVEQFCGFSERSAQGYCKLHNDLRDLTKAQRAALFNRHQSQRAVTLFLSESQKSKEKEPVMPEPKPVKPERILPTPDIEPWFTGPEEPVDNGPVEPVRNDDPLPAPEKQSEHHSPEPWTPFGRQVIDANQHIVAQCHNEQDAYRIATCVNAMGQEEG